MFLGNPMMMRKLASGPNIANLFATTLWSATTGSQSITTGIDLAGKGGLLWIKARTGSSRSHVLFDTLRGADNALSSNLPDQQYNGFTPDYFGGFGSNGFSLGSLTDVSTGSGTSGAYAAWSFARAARFFDVVTWTGDGAYSKVVAHGLGMSPGLVVIKRTDSAANWRVFARKADGTYTLLFLNLTNSGGSAANFGTSAVTSSGLDVGYIDSELEPGVNTSGGTYVAYLFAHDTAADGVVQCGSYTGNGSTTGPTITLGWQPQWLLIKNASSSGDVWVMFDTVRGQTGSNDYFLMADNSGAEASDSTVRVDYNGAGFQITGHSSAINGNGNTLVYIAIRAAA